jgi:hypothetical protein
MIVKFLNRNFFQRIFGQPATPKPLDPHCWSFSDGKILNRPEPSDRVEEARRRFEIGRRWIAHARAGNPWR